MTVACALAVPAAVAGGAVPAVAAATTQAVAGTQYLSGLGCSSASACVATGESSPSNSVVVDFTNGVPGAVQAVPGAGTLYKVGCASGGDCLAVGYNSSGGVVVPVVNGTPGAPQVVAGTFYLEDVACPSTTTCVAVGRNSSGQGVFVPVTNGVPGAAQVVAGIFALYAVACPSTAVCQTGGSIKTSSGWEGAAVLISNGTPGSVQPVPGTNELSGMACVSITSCEASSQSSSATTVGEVVPVTGGIPGAPRPVPGTFGLDSVACASATLCEASGQTSPAEGEVVPLINGTPGAAQLVPGTNDLKSVVCPSATGCLAVGTGQGDSVGVITAFAAAPTIVSLTFDNGAISQYTLGYQQALSLHNVTATFYVNSGIMGGAKHMSWSQLSTLAAAGEEIGGKTVDGTKLTTLTASQQIAEICNDRQALISHGLSPAGFAYPAGAFNATIGSEVQNCGYNNARTAGSLSPAGPVYAETLPPKNMLALRAYAPNGRVTLANLESLVAGAAAHGGWVPIVIQKVCSQTADPNNYATCTASSGWIDLADLNAFLTWVQNAGQSGAVPFGTGFGALGAIAAAYAGGSG